MDLGHEELDIRVSQVLGLDYVVELQASEVDALDVAVAAALGSSFVSDSDQAGSPARRRVPIDTGIDIHSE